MASSSDSSPQASDGLDMGMGVFAVPEAHEVPEVPEVPLAFNPTSSAQVLRGHGDASTRTSSIHAVPSACLACRSKHLKCDGWKPCSRCTSANLECTYIASRRGYKGPGRKRHQQPAKSLVLMPARQSASVTYGPPAVSISSHAPVTSVTSIPSSTPAFDPSIALPNFDLDFPLVSQTSAPSSQYSFAFDRTFGFPVETLSFGLTPLPTPNPTFKDRYLDAFYHNFHAAHPFTLPKDYLLSLSHGEPTIEPLLATIRWIGSIFVDAPSTSAKLLDYAYHLVYKPDIPKDGFIVQAMLLLIIGLDGNRQRDKVHQLLTDIQNVAVQIGLNKRWFADLNGRNVPILEESWRRTWWDLYIVDALIAGVHRSTNFSMYTIPTDVALPCEEEQYISGFIPQPLYLEDMDNITFLDNCSGFSSFAYRIQCACYLGKLIHNPPIFGAKDKNIGKIQALLTNWRLHLPASKSNMLYKDGKLDEMMFQAFMMINAISILLHQPHSQLDPSLTSYIDACAPTTPALSSDTFNMHTKHTIRSANELSKLIGHRVSLLSHTHFFAYMVTLASTIHLSEWTLSFVPHNDDTLRQRIRLSIGVLGQYARIWPASAHLRNQVKRIAQNVYQVKKQRMFPLQGMGLSQAQITAGIASEAGAISWDAGIDGHG
ncbi:hypothetical protein G7Z17_g716 [Cylindrodendrum hubeiense]|uniref:Zn(2)-C6 fungal-type domain-containing protein n=1 Tax=Cylindrodendrum hubeiense TaxID=595255 RepID=A0A9P5HG77_9HYPO|nr:hypothetical protein G7Z17_g716 [Cylindrodendrum hubeiense]